MTILQLKYFEAVYAARNMTRAAERLYVSQPSVSTAIKELRRRNRRTAVFAYQSLTAYPGRANAGRYGSALTTKF